MVLMFLVLVVASTVPSISRSQNATIGVYRLNGSPACPMSPGESALVLVKLVHTAGPVKTMHFTLVPSCAGATISGPLGSNVTFSPCAMDGQIISVLNVTAPATCGVWGFYFDVRGPNGEYSIPMTDCDGYPMTAGDAFVSIDGPPCDDMSTLIAPYRPTPANGATGVAVNTLLSYFGPANKIRFSSVPLTISMYDQVLCGPSPACAQPINPGALAPNTTYYWAALNERPFLFGSIAASSETFSFTTGDAPLPTEGATWGRIKAMYRD